MEKIEWERVECCEDEPELQDNLHSCKINGHFFWACEGRDGKWTVSIYNLYGDNVNLCICNTFTSAKRWLSRHYKDVIKKYYREEV